MPIDSIDPELLLSDSALRAAFPSSTLEAGRVYELRGRVQELQIENRGGLITAMTVGSVPDPYPQRITVTRSKWRGVSINGRCGCPVGLNCKHVAAVLIAAHREEVSTMPAPAETPRANGLRDQGEGWGRGPLTVSRPSIAPPIEDRLPFEISNWLTDLEQAEDTESEAYPPDIRHRLLYVLDTDPTPRGVPSLRIQAVTALIRKDGAIGNAKPYAFHQVRTAAKYLRPSDKLILSRLDRHASSHSGQTNHEDPLDLLRRVIATKRAFWASPHGVPVTEGPARPGRIVWNLAPDGSQRTAMELEDGLVGLRVPAPWYADPETGVIGPVALDLLSPVANKLLSAPSIPPELVPKVRAEMARRMPARPVPAPETLSEPERIETPVRPILRLMDGTLPRDPTRGRGSAKFLGDGLFSVPVARLSFGYGPVTLPSSAAQRPRLVASGRTLYEPVRDQRGEAAALERLGQIGFGRVSHLIPTYYQHAHTNDFALLEGDADTDWIDVVTRDVPKLRAEGWDVEIDGNFPFQIISVDSALDAALEESSGIDWLELHLGVTVDGERVDLVPALIRLIARPERLFLEDDDDAPFLLPLPDGRTLALAMGRIRPTLMALIELFEGGGIDPDSGKIGFSRLAAADLARLEESAGVTWQGGEALRALGRVLRDAGGAIPKAAVPDTFIGTLRPYQAQGVDWLQFLRSAELGGILADDMGLGKTVQTLAHLLIEQAQGRLVNPALIVCPTSLIPNWTLEAAKFAPGLKVLVLHGTGRKALFRQIPKHDLVLTTYPLLARDHEVLTEQAWHAVILDEAQTIKNPNAETTRQALRLKAGQRLCLSGTPLQNHLGELWSLFDFLAPGFLGGQRAFRTRYRMPIEKHGDVEKQELLTRRVRPFLLRRTKEEVATELPPKTEITESVEMEPAQRAIYEGIRLAMHTRVQAAIAQKGLARSGIIILDALLKLRQACCDPRLLKLKAVEKSKAGSAKLDRLMDMLTVLREEGRRVLLFSQFTEMLALIEQRFHEDGIDYVMLTGDTKDRATPVRRFQTGEVPVFLISLKAGGVGLNLTAADTVIHYDPWWNPAVEDQATDRAHRIGQTKKVFVHRLVMLGTIEQKMEVLKEKKRSLVASVLEAERGGALKMSEADIEALFAPVA